jgi:hypothetical protein
VNARGRGSGGLCVSQEEGGRPDPRRRITERRSGAPDLIAAFDFQPGGHLLATKEPATSKFRELELKASIAPGQSGWPATEHLHWTRLNTAADEARSRLGEFLEVLDEIEADPRLSREGKQHDRRKAAVKALASLEGSKSLEAARASVASVMAKWEAKLSAVVKPPKDHGEAVIAAQIRDRLSNMSDMKDRMAFLQRHGGDPTVASAILLAPPFLSGLSDAELALVRSKIERVALPPEVIEAKAAVAKALAEVERGWLLANDKIASRGGLEKGPRSAAA